MGHHAPVLVLDDIAKAFGSTVAVDGLSLTIKQGEVFGLLGPNGAGKTTTMSLAAGLLAPDSGSIVVAGQGLPTDPRVRQRIGLAPQALALYDELSAVENLRLFGRLYGITGHALAERVDELLELVGLTDRRSSRAGSYSGGMKRRLNLAAALVHKPSLVLLDEPTAGVDPQSRNRILELVGTIRQAGGTVVYSTHYMEEAQRLCDRVAIVDHGRLIAQGTVDELIAQQGGRSLVIAEVQGQIRRVETHDPVAEVASLLARGEARSLRIEQPDLESVFLGMTGRSLRD